MGLHCWILLCRFSQSVNFFRSGIVHEAGYYITKPLLFVEPFKHLYCMCSFDLVLCQGNGGAGQEPLPIP